MNYAAFQSFQTFGYWGKIEIKIYIGYLIFLFSLSENNKM